MKTVSAVELVAELRAVGVPMSATRLSISLSEKQRYALAFLTVTCLTRILPEDWVDWFVERASGFEKNCVARLLRKQVLV